MAVIFEFKHLCEVDLSFVENAGQRLDIVKFPRIIGDCWRERERAREREKKREWSSGHPGDSPNLELRALLGGLMSPFFPHVKNNQEHTYMYKTPMFGLDKSGVQLLCKPHGGGHFSRGLESFG